MDHKRKKTKKGQATVRCPICDFTLKNPKKSYLPHCFVCSKCTGHFIGKAKKVQYPESYFDEGKNFFWFSDLLEIPLKFFLGLRLLYIKRTVNKKRIKILDYGCGSGQLVKRLQDEGINIIGFEPSFGALKITKRLKLPVFRKVKKIKGGYDLIMFWHSLEHTDNPGKVIKNSSRLLSFEGKFIIAVPNADSFNAKVGREKWFHFTYPLHRVHFTPRSLSLVLNQAGMKVEKIDFFNPEYTLSGLVQTFLNLFLPKDVLYTLVAHRRSVLSQGEIIFYSLLSIFFLVLASPIIIIIFYVELFFKKTDAIVITACKLAK